MDEEIIISALKLYIEVHRGKYNLVDGAYEIRPQSLIRARQALRQMEERMK